MRYLLLIAFALGSFKSFASHIVGGEMVYDYLGNDSFKVRMQYYVDCVNGIPGAIADDKYAYISILNSDTFVTQAVVRRSMPIRLNETNYTCVTSYGNVCVDMYLYDTFFVLPPIKGGYDVVFQRCCRNGTILNIQGPDSTGATYTAHIPEMNSTITHNSNPRFNKLPPNYLCLNEVLYFDHSATDPDGDSLFYRLHTPFDGGTSLSPRPKTPTKYSEVIWRKGYSDSVPIIVKDSIFLNEHNGRLVLTPRILGQFVFGIAVEEYRNDSLISTTYRDYQFNVVRCNNTIGADFYAPNPWCSKRVLLESFVSNGTNYKWYVDSVILTNQWSYLHQFPDTGRYNVKLVVFDGNCKDSVTKTVRIVSDSFSLGIDSFESCKQGMVEFETKFINDAVYDWQINGDWQLVDRNHVVHQPANAGWHWVKLEFLDCYMFDSFYVTDISPALGIDIPPLICSDSLRLDLSKGKFDNYNLDAPNATVYRDNYLAPIIVFKDTGTYYFSIDYNIKNCISFLFEQIRYLEEGSLKNFETELCKNDSLTIIATYFENATYNWLNRPT
ncbi:MAG: PKD domain-containing protein, partial [Bacteroidetes bacterium]|nr:PKD domain-containing protein [Bacteroidota bacterium]